MWIFHTLSQPEETAALCLHFAFETKDTERVSDLLMVTQPLGEESGVQIQLVGLREASVLPVPLPTALENGEGVPGAEPGAVASSGLEDPPCLSTPPLPAYKRDPGQPKDFPFLAAPRSEPWGESFLMSAACHPGPLVRKDFS